MLKTKLKKTAAILVLSLAFAACLIGEIDAQTEHSINITDKTWDHSTIRILLIPQESQPWWNATFVDMSLQAVDAWNSAHSTFASKFPEFAHLSDIRLEATESAGAAQDFDVYVTWKEQITDRGVGAVGSAQLYVQSGVITSCNVTLAAKDMLGIPLTNTVRQTIAIHEIGHALGLLHANYSDDVMFTESSFDISVRPISTLDVYGVAQVFRWRSISSQFNPDNQEERSGSVTLPSGISYDYLNEPQQDSLTRIVSSFLRYIQTPEGLIRFIVALSIIFGITVIVSAVITFSRRHKKQNGQ